MSERLFLLDTSVVLHLVRATPWGGTSNNASG